MRLLEHPRSLSVKLAATYSLLLLLVAGVLTFSLYWQLRNAQLQAIRERLLDIISFTQPVIVGDFHSQIRTAADEETLSYSVVARRLESTQLTIPAVRQIYTLRQQPDGRITYVIDGTEASQRAHVGDAYPRETPLFQNGLAAITEPVVDDTLHTGPDGAVRLSGYAPIYDNLRQVDGLLGIDIDASSVVANEERAMRNALLTFLATAPLAVLAGWLLGRRLMMPIGELLDGASRVAAGQFDEPVPAQSQDELGLLADSFNTMQTGLRTSRQQLEHYAHNMEERVDQLNLINLVGRYATSLLAQEDFLPTIAELIRTAFDYYAVMIVLVDKEHDIVALRAAATEEDVDLMEGGLFIPLSTQSIVGTVASMGEPLVVSDVTTDSRYRPEKRLPLTRSELALPLRIGKEVLGVLDLESKHLNAFKRDDVRVLQTLADQIAVAIHNANLYRGQADLSRVAELARGEAEEANRLKSQFLANMSHELRTPLNSIINFAYLLMMGVEGDLTEGQEDLLRRIEDAGQHLLGLINDILDLAKIEAGRLELFFEEVAVQEIVDGVLSTAQALVHKKPIALHCEVPADLPFVWADRTRVRQVLLNLLSNAAKFTEEGSITVRAWVDEGGVTVSVQDTGVGIVEEDLPKVFAEFVQVDGSLTRQVGGTGLGLPISKRFVELHGGTMEVKSEPGVGSTFFFTLPHLAPTAPTAPVQSNAEESKVREARVLIIDDDPVVWETISQHLAPGYQVLKVSDSRQVLEQARTLQPDVVVLDVMMPHKDGWEVLQALKEDPLTEHIPVVVCSILREQQLALSLQANDYLIKPVDRKSLQRVIEQFVPPGGKVLAVDDDPNALEIVRRMLDGLTYHVSTAPDGPSGLEAAFAQEPDVIVLDLMMPGLSGFEVLAKLRMDERTAHLPVVVLSAKDLTMTEQEQLRAEATTFLQKGQFTPEEFNQTVRRAVARNSQGEKKE
ncbi:MAG: response regulator [Ardenticatenales bacterium]|nr:response regulator [Ardenticatenales bacterium]